MITTVRGWIIGIGAIAGAIGAVLAIFLIFFPGLRPCFGDATAQFQDIDVTKVGPLEGVVSYTVQTHGYEGRELQVLWSLMRVDRNGVSTPVADLVKRPGATLKPTSCSSDQGGEDIPMPVFRKGTYVVVLELLPPGDDARITRATAQFRL